MTYLSIGHKVVVNIPEEDLEYNTMLKPFQGREMKIADRASKREGRYVYYHLVGAEGKNGVPYSFLRDWLIPKLI